MEFIRGTLRKVGEGSTVVKESEAASTRNVSFSQFGIVCALHEHAALGQDAITLLSARVGVDT